MNHRKLSQLFIPIAVLITSSTFAGEYPFRSDDPIGRAVVAKIGKTRTLLGYFCLHRETNPAGILGCVRMQFASSPEDQVTHDMAGNLVSDSWTTLGPVLTLEAANAFAASAKSSENGLQLFNRIWNEGIWDRSEDGWQYKPKEIASRDLSDFIVLLGTQGSAALSQIEEDPALKERMDFAGWSVDQKGNWSDLIRVDVSQTGSISMKIYEFWGEGGRMTARKKYEFSEAGSTLNYGVSNTCGLAGYSGPCRFVKFRTAEEDQDLAIYRDGTRIVMQRFRSNSYSSGQRWETIRRLTDEEVKKKFKIRN